MLEGLGSVGSPHKRSFCLDNDAHEVLVVRGGDVVQLGVDALEIVVQTPMDKLGQVGSCPDLVDNLLMRRRRRHGQVLAALVCQFLNRRSH